MPDDCHKPSAIIDHIVDSRPETDVFGDMQALMQVKGSCRYVLW